MPKIPGGNHLDAVKALEKAGLRILRQRKHIVISDGIRIVTVPRHNPVNSFTMGGIARDAGSAWNNSKNLFDNAAIQQIIGRERRKREFIADLQLPIVDLVRAGRIKLNRYTSCEWQMPDVSGQN